MKSELLEFALLLAQAAESEIMSRFRACEISWKPDGSEVTDADRRAEEVMRQLITRHFGSAAVVGEEYGGPECPTFEPLWLLDPIDGTASFAVGLPIFGTLIAYMENGEPEVGVIHMPALGETLYAAKGSGCWKRIAGGKPTQVHVSGITDLDRAYVSATCPSSSRSWASGALMADLNKIIGKARKFRFIGDCVQHSLVARGRIDGAVEPIVHPWDIAPLVPCIEESGGTVTDLEGRREGVVWQPNLLSSSSAELHREILSVLQAKTWLQP